MIVEKYIDDVNSVYNKVSLDQKKGEKLGVDLPVHTMLLKSISNVRLTTFDGFLLIEADPKKFE